MNKKVTPQGLKQTVLRDLTLAWGLAEAGIGGVLHALKVPFTGMAVSAIAVQFISLIAANGNRKGSVLNSLKSVLLIKAAGSPHTPVTAYFAVTVQGVLGELLFLPGRFRKLSAMLLGFLSSVLSGTQKLFVLWLTFGTSFYASLDAFIKYVIEQFLGKGVHSGSAVELIAGGYLLLHAVTGIAAGRFAGLLPEYIASEKEKDEFKQMTAALSGEQELPKRKKRRAKTGNIIAAVAIVMVILTYILPGLSSGNKDPLWLLLLRPFAVLFIWYTVLSPLATRLLRKLLKSETPLEDTEQTGRINQCLVYSYRTAKQETGSFRPFKRLARFSTLFFSLIT